MVVVTVNNQAFIDQKKILSNHSKQLECLRKIFCLKFDYHIDHHQHRPTTTTKPSTIDDTLSMNDSTTLLHHQQQQQKSYNHQHSRYILKKNLKSKI